MCCDDAYLVTPRVSPLAGCDKLVSEPLIIEKRFVFLLFSEFYFDLRATRYQKIQKRSPIERSLRGPKENVFEESEEEVDSDLLSDARIAKGTIGVTNILKRTKTRPKPDKTKHENGKSAKNQSRRHTHLLRTNPGPINGSGQPKKG
ncbi:hypothetical protein Tco_0417817 [Tanacetum coccineum]